MVLLCLWSDSCTIDYIVYIIVLTCSQSKGDRLFCQNTDEVIDFGLADFLQRYLDDLFRLGHFLFVEFLVFPRHYNVMVLLSCLHFFKFHPVGQNWKLLQLMFNLFSQLFIVLPWFFPHFLVGEIHRLNGLPRFAPCGWWKAHGTRGDAQLLWLWY